MGRTWTRSHSALWDGEPLLLPPTPLLPTSSPSPNPLPQPRLQGKPGENSQVQLGAKLHFRRCPANAQRPLPLTTWLEVSTLFFLFLKPVKKPRVNFTQA